MIKEIIEKWESNKGKLESKFKTIKQHDSFEYVDIVKWIFTYVINSDDYDDYDNFDVDKMTIIDDGGYQGTQIFITPRGMYQPSIEDYIVTDTYYGSCSGCDTLQKIKFDYDYDSESEFISDKQVKELMMLSLHLVQKMKYLG